MKYQIVTIEREYASGGNEIGQKVAERLQIPCYGREVLEIAAKKMNTIPSELESLEETATNSFLYSISMAAKVAMGEKDGLSEESKLYLVEEQVIQDLAYQSPCVVVGRCAGWALRERKNVLNVFIHADVDYRRKRAVEAYCIEPAKVDNILRKYDRRRGNFYGANTSLNWSDSSNYHLVLDSSKLGLEVCADIICRLMK